MMLNELRAYFKSSIGFCVGLYLLLGITAWISNGYFGAHFVIKDLTDIFVWVFAQLTANHVINSGLNSPRGEAPK